MLIDCKNCGAPLDVPERGWFTTCGYCRTTQRVAKPPQGIYATPPDWRAPQTWTPPAQVPAHTAQPLKYDPYAAKQKTRGVVTMIVLLGAVLPIFVVVGIAGFVVAAVPGSNRDRSAGTPSTSTSTEDWDGEDTFSCSSFDKPVLKDLDLYVKAKPPFRIEGQCKITIVDSKLRLEHWFDPGDMHNQMTIRGSTITLEKAPSSARLGRMKLERTKLSLPSTSAWRVKQKFEAIGGEIVFRDENGFEGDGINDVELDGTTVRVEGRAGQPTVLFTSDSNAGFEMKNGSVYLKAGGAKDPITLARCSGIGDAELDGTKVFVVQDPAPGRFVLFDLGSINASGEMKGGAIDAGKQTIFMKGRKASLDGTDLNGSPIFKGR